ncbi:monocarboxylate permease-like protein [Diplodia corticola]|uniref:Monocarboxylate permease-like protein n=1 Tax=Diplodia corticola TaxID=236234 RepID=A0A1J9QSC1_9PEZI|nr:monocarboxylate permease-like protein [Diplodia corticola]OJD30874.1 monocarboxylate permease-like protein [Diplodia corticola]
MAYTVDERGSWVKPSDKDNRASWLSGSTQYSYDDPEQQDSGVPVVSAPAAPGSSQSPSEKPNTPAAAGDFPEGGFRAWSVAVGTAAALFCTMGYLNSYGVYQTYYESHQLSFMTPSAISWIGSLQNFFVFFSSLFGGALFDRYGGPVIVAPAAAAYVLSIMMTSLCTEYWQFVLAQGVLGGISNGMVMSPALAATSQYFSKRRGAAMGLSIAGASLGAVVFPIALVKMLPDASSPNIGFPWAVRVCGFIALGMLIWPCMAIRARLPPRKNSLILLSAFRRPVYLATVAATFLLFLGFFTPLYYLPSYAVAHAGLSPSLSNYLLAILNGASFFGRIVPGILADKLGRFNTLAFAGVSSGILTLCWTRCTTAPTVIAFAALYGFSSGAVVSGFTVALAFCADQPKNIGTYMGMGMAVASIAMLIGPPVNGVLLARYGGFDGMAILSGVVCIAGGLVSLAAKVLQGKGVLSLS